MADAVSGESLADLCARLRDGEVFVHFEERDRAADFIEAAAEYVRARKREARIAVVGVGGRGRTFAGAIRETQAAWSRLVREVEGPAGEG